MLQNNIFFKFLIQKNISLRRLKTRTRKCPTYNKFRKFHVHAIEINKHESFQSNFPRKKHVFILLSKFSVNFQK